MKILLTGVADVHGGTEKVVKNIVSGLYQEYDFNILKTTPKDAAFHEEFKNHGVNELYLPGIFGLKSVFKRRNLVKNFLKSNQVDVLHVNAPTVNSIFFVKAAADVNIPVIYHLHNSQSSGNARLELFISKVLQNYFAKYILNHATKVVTVSEDAAKSWFGNRYAEVDVLTNGIDSKTLKYTDDSRFKVRKELGVCDEDRVAIMIARLESIKNYPKAIQIMAGLINKGVDRFWIIGEGSKKNELQQFISTFETDVSSKIQLLGEKENVSDYLSAADVSILTSKSEGLGLSVIEAQANGLHVVVSEGVPSDVDVTGQVTFMDQDDTLESWREKILQAVNIKCDRNSQNKKVQMSTFDSKVFIDKVRSLYQGK